MSESDLASSSSTSLVAPRRTALCRMSCDRIMWLQKVCRRSNEIEIRFAHNGADKNSCYFPPSNLTTTPIARMRGSRKPKIMPAMAMNVNLCEKRKIDANQSLSSSDTAFLWYLHATYNDK